MCKVAEIVVAILLAIIGFEDWKTKYISWWLLATATIVIAVLRFTVVDISLWDTAAGIAIGGLFFLISRFTREAIGYGDSWLILILGIFTGGRRLLLVVFVAMFAISTFAIAAAIKSGWNRKKTIPFVPFLFLAYVGVMFV